MRAAHLHLASIVGSVIAMASIVLKGRHDGIKEDDRSERQQTRRDATRDTGVVEEQERLGVCEYEAVWPLCVRVQLCCT